VTGPDGKPVVGAIAGVFGWKKGPGPTWGQIRGADPVGITNAKGEFLITATQEFEALSVRVEAPGLATQNLVLEMGETVHEIELGEGATVSGRAMKDGKPLAGIKVGLVQEDRGAGSFTGVHTIGTDEEGKFKFLNVAPEGKWVVYGTMSSMGDKGAIQSVPVQVDGEGTTADAGDITVGRSRKVSGRVVLSDDKPVPAKTRVMLSRGEAWDSQSVMLDEKGQFAFEGVPEEGVDLSVRLPGYRLSRKNRSMDVLNGFSLHGRVDGDVEGLTILMEPGEVERVDSSDHEAMEEMAKARVRRIEGVPAVVRK
jgi:hypothetical protein